MGGAGSERARARAKRVRRALRTRAQTARARHAAGRQSHRRVHCALARAQTPRPESAARAPAPAASSCASGSSWRAYPTVSVQRRVRWLVRTVTKILGDDKLDVLETGKASTVHTGRGAPPPALILRHPVRTAAVAARATGSRARSSMLPGVLNRESECARPSATPTATSQAQGQCETALPSQKAHADTPEVCA